MLNYIDWIVLWCCILGRLEMCDVFQSLISLSPGVSSMLFHVELCLLDCVCSITLDYVVLHKVNAIRLLFTISCYSVVMLCCVTLVV